MDQGPLVKYRCYSSSVLLEYIDFCLPQHPYRITSLCPTCRECNGSFLKQTCVVPTLTYVVFSCIHAFLMHHHVVCVIESCALMSRNFWHMLGALINLVSTCPRIRAGCRCSSLVSCLHGSKVWLSQGCGEQWQNNT